MAQASTRGFDAGREHLGHVYGQALLGAAEQAGLTDEVMVELDSVVDDVLAKLPNLADTLSAPKVSLDDKERIIDKAFSRASRVLVNGLKVMARHGRIEVIGDVRNAYRKLYNELRNRVEVHIRLAAPVSDVLLEQITNQLRTMLKKEVDLKIEIRPEMLGGLIVKVGDTLLDGSVKTRLDQMREKTLASTERQIRQSLERFVAV